MERDNIGSEDLHELDGLMHGGLDEDGDIEWLGSAKQWREYSRLVEEEEQMRILIQQPNFAY